MTSLKNWQQIIIDVDTPLLEVIKRIDSVGSRFALVTKNNQFIGTVTDGDIRRTLIKGLPLDTKAGMVANLKPLFAFNDLSNDKLRKLCLDYSVNFIPILNPQFHIENVYIFNDAQDGKTKENPVVIMAGGLGSRLGDLTRECPKPMLEVNGKPILEHIILECRKNGFTDFYLSVNYLSDQIKEYFQDGSLWNVSIKYLNEKKRLGTAGSLHMLKLEKNLPILVLNGDILTKVNFSELLKFHTSNKADITTCVRTFDYKVPYGVVAIEKNQITEIQEKPVQRFQVNAGVYVVEENYLNMIPEDQYFDMTDFLQNSINQQKRVMAFLIHEYWKDIGHKTDLHSAREEFLG
jgi:dTDP-glucose pyrophosphorylase